MGKNVEGTAWCWRACALVGCLAQLGCTSLDGLSQKPLEATESCELVHAPGYPVINGQPGGSIEIVAAVKAYDHGENDNEAGTRRYRTMGYDLDGTCTRLGQGRSCIRREWSTADDSDGPGGRDNAVGDSLHQVKADGGTSG